MTKFFPFLIISSASLVLSSKESPLIIGDGEQCFSTADRCLEVLECILSSIGPKAFWKINGKPETTSHCALEAYCSKNVQMSLITTTTSGSLPAQTAQGGSGTVTNIPGSISNDSGIMMAAMIQLSLVSLAIMFL